MKAPESRGNRRARAWRDGWQFPPRAICEIRGKLTVSPAGQWDVYGLSWRSNASSGQEWVLDRHVQSETFREWVREGEYWFRRRGGKEWWCTVCQDWLADIGELDVEAVLIAALRLLSFSPLPTTHLISLRPAMIWQGSITRSEAQEIASGGG
jgi:hypothetical protein